MNPLAETLAILVSATCCFLLACRCGVRFPHRGRSVLNYALPVVLTVLALSVAASARGDEPETNIWRVGDRDYFTDMPNRWGPHARLMRWEPSKDPAVHTLSTYSYSPDPVKRAPRREWAAAAAVRVAPGAPPCVGVYLGNAAFSGGAAVCPGQKAEVYQERVRRRGSIVTTTDTVLTIGGREVMRIRGGLTGWGVARK